jgi:hypothetical protein
VIHRALGRPVPVELTGDGRVRGRVGRLTAVSLVALGVITWLAATTTAAGAPVIALLAAGWVLMPAVLAWSLVEPGVRYLLAVPASCVSLGLLGVCIEEASATGAVPAGWLLVLAGVLFGASMGLWVWYRILPVPAALDSPVAAGRWALIGVHVALVLAGLALIVSGQR